MTDERPEYELRLPDFLSDRYGAWETQEKGYLDAVIVLRGRVHEVTFYDPIRLAQDVAQTLEAGSRFFAAPHLIVVASISADVIAAAVEEMSTRGFRDLLEDPEVGDD